MDEQTISAVVAEIQRLARNGVAPSQDRYNEQRDRALPSIYRLHRANVNWWHLVERAGLALSPAASPHRTRRYGDAFASGNVPQHITAEIEKRLSARRAARQEWLNHGLPVVESSRRVREFYVHQRDGSVLRVVQESVSLR